MSDHNAAIRSITLPTVFGWLGVDLRQFRNRKGKNGPELYGKCVYHEAKNNTTSFSFNDKLGHCFSCGAKVSGAIDAVKLYRKCGFQEAVDWLKERQGSQPTPDNKKPPVEAAGEAEDGVLKPYTGKYEKFRVPCPWLEARIPDAGIREKYGVFRYDNPKRKSAYSGRVMIPVRDVEGVLYGYLGRAVTTEQAVDDNHRETNTAKYLFPKNLPKSQFLFGADLLKAGMFGPLPLKRVFLLESPFAVMKLASMGLPACSPYGWSVSTEQLQLLAQLARGVVYLPDRNKRQDAANTLHSMASCLWLRFPPLPAGIDDPEKMTREQVLAL